GTRLAKLVGSVTGSNIQFGISVDIDNGWIAVGAMNDPDRGNIAGATYLYREFCGGWLSVGKTYAPTTDKGDRFGRAVALDAGTLFVGATNVDVGGVTKPGAAYAFDLPILNSAPNFNTTNWGALTLSGS